MLLPKKQLTGTLIKRYKRFLADIRLDDNSVLTVHCPNSGSMLGCSEPGSPVILSHSSNPKRKYPWTLEMIKKKSTWIGINTGMTNKIVHEALEQGVITEFGQITKIQPEITVSAKSRLDFLLETEKGHTYLEVKNCSLAERGVAMFPDAVTARGTKHLRELATLCQQGYGAALLFCIQRDDTSSFTPAQHIDPLYAATFREVREQGVLVVAYEASVTPEAITITHPVKVKECPPDTR